MENIQTKIREIDLFDFTSFFVCFFGLDFLKFSEKSQKTLNLAFEVIMQLMILVLLLFHRKMSSIET